jgi:2-alkenal reductase
MNRRRFAIIAGLGCGATILLLLVAAPLITLNYFPLFRSAGSRATSERTLVPGAIATQARIPTVTIAPEVLEQVESPIEAAPLPSLRDQYQELTPGVVTILSYLTQEGATGQGAGSGFIFNAERIIVTNNHVVANADIVTVVFYNGLEVEAELIGADTNSDLAVLQVDDLPDDTHPLSLGDSDAVRAGDWVMAIGNPFRQQSSLTLGVVSAVDRMIPAGVTPFSIPEAIQTDAAINPGNSGGPLLNLEGKVIGVNAQIASGGARANAGVGFAIPSKVVRRVVPALIETGTYRWPWLGVVGGEINLVRMGANDLDRQRGAYIDQVEEGGPAKKAGLRGSTGTETVFDMQVSKGGDIVTAIDGEPINFFSDLVAEIAFHSPGEELTLTILREGETMRPDVTIEARPEQG